MQEREELGRALERYVDVLDHRFGVHTTEPLDRAGEAPVLFQRMIFWYVIELSRFRPSSRRTSGFSAYRCFEHQNQSVSQRQMYRLR